MQRLSVDAKGFGACYLQCGSPVTDNSPAERGPVQRQGRKVLQGAHQQTVVGYGEVGGHWSSLVGGMCNGRSTAVA